MIETWKIPALFATGVVAGFVDSIAGGDGLITLPALLSLLPDPQLALGTNKLQATFGSGSAAGHYAHGGVVDLRDCGRGCAVTFLGAALGTLAVRSLDTQFLKVAVPLLLIAVAAYTWRRPQLGQQERAAKIARWQFDVLFGLLLGFYDGFFGPGVGTFWTMAFVVCLGFNLTRATGYTKAVNFASNVCSLLIFLAAGKVDFAAGGSMGLGQLIGARFGSRMVLCGGTSFIRPVFISVVLVLATKLLYDAYVK
jgi:uncharacterized membrane protein YfcA